METNVKVRQEWMSVLAKAPSQQLATLMPDLPAHDVLRAPEIGAVMVQGRIGATGARFNLGEMTVTRCSVRLDQTEGHACVQGRCKDHARRAAVLDALMQGGRADYIRHTVLKPLIDAAQSARKARAEKAAATRVEFFTMMRGED